MPLRAYDPASPSRQSLVEKIPTAHARRCSSPVNFCLKIGKCAIQADQFVVIGPVATFEDSHVLHVSATATVEPVFPKASGRGNVAIEGTPFLHRSRAL
jgi:hypothetical protein